ncbi:hypothetical protein NMY22_g7448 [Coprinellus aureogranulatus]|nr:hypothetical protein NMY22_g7448 [Coprinellus aureogranulatus]
MSGHGAKTLPGHEEASERRPEQGFDWKLVVEDRLFRVLRHGFESHSHVFEDMFRLPANNSNQSVEGSSTDNPIVLDGHSANDFAALLWVLYPSALQIATGGLQLSKKEWTGVLRLATMWDMWDIREFAIRSLSNDAFKLTALEKVCLAHAHKVPQWFIEGTTTLVEDWPSVSPEELASVVGLKTAYQISVLQLQLAPIKQSNKVLDSSEHLQFGADTFRCNICRSALITVSTKCRKCSRQLSDADSYSKPTIQIKLSDYAPTLEYSKIGLVLRIRGGAVACVPCGGSPFADLKCPSCYRWQSWSGKGYPEIFILVDSTSERGIRALVEESFKQEIHDLQYERPANPEMAY